MTRRAIVTGLICSFVLCSITYFSQSVMHQSAIVGNYMPLSVYGTLIIVVAGLNPLLGCMRSSWRFSGRELAVILTLSLATCGIAESGFLKTFTNVLMLPKHYRRTAPAWSYEDTGTFPRLPTRMLAETGESDEALNGFLQGKVGQAPMSLGDVPWEAWRVPLMTWLPLVALLIIGFIALALVVHRQWANHEKLPYPIATFAAELLGRDGEGTGSVLKQRAFWIAAGAVFAVHMINFGYQWWPDYLIRIKTSFDLRPLLNIMPTLRQGRLAGSILNCRLYFAVIGVAYLVSTDVSFSFAVVPVFGTWVQGVLASYGISFMGGGEHRASVYTSLNIGSFVAFAFMIAYLGRRHYGSVLRRSVGLPTEDEVHPHEYWGGRVYLLCTVLCTMIMIAYGLAWPCAIFYMLMINVFYIGVSRVVA